MLTLKLLLLVVYVQLQSIQLNDANIEKISNHLSSITPSINVICSTYKTAFQSPTSGTTRQMNIVLNTNYGYSKLYYFFEFYNAYFTPIQLTIQEGGQIIQTKILNSSNSINFCGQSCQHYYLNLISETGFNSPLEIFTLQINTSTNFWITNLQVYAMRCDQNCKFCLITKCQICMETFTLIKGICKCTYPNYIQFNGKCISECPTGFYNNLVNCQPIISSQSLLSNNNEPQLIPNYNTQIRSLQNSIDGINFYGPIRFNEKIKYNLAITFPSAQNVIFEAILLIFYPQSFQEIQIWFGQHLVQTIVLSGFDDVANYNITSCAFTNISSCQRIYFHISFSDVINIENIQIFSNLELNQTQSFWGVQQIKLYSVIPIIQICTKKIYQDNCVEECPIWTISDGNICKDYTNIYPFYSVIGTGFYNISFILKDKILFSGWKSTENNCCQYFQDKFILGGYLIWNNDTLSAKFIITSSHYKLFLKFTVILIDIQNSEDGLLVNFGKVQKKITKSYPNAICSNSLGQAGCQASEDLGQQDLDYFIEIQEEILHNKQELDLQFTCISTTGNSYCAIQNLLILSVDCPLNCQYCRSNTECIQLIEKDLKVYNQCPFENYYSDSGQCKPCQIYCKTCSNQVSCLTCDDTNFQFYGGQCYSKLTFAENYSTFTASQCHQSCSSCIHQFYQNYKYFPNDVCTCDIEEKKVLNLHLCICIDGYFMDESNSTQNCYSCGSKCKTCNSSILCLSCYSDQNRILDDNKCICKNGYYEFVQPICLECISTCKTCINSVDLCTSCFSSQFRTLSQQNTCVCQIGYYEDQNQICQKCNQFCENCENSYQCLTCDINQFRTLLNKNCECQEGYYEDQNKQCLECYYTCSKCNNSNKYNQCTLCPSTRIKSSNFQDQFECKCKIGYYDDFYLNCLSCLDYIDPPSNHYCYSKCGDLIIQWNEECDDGNLEQRDDCNQCYFPNSSCGNQYCLQCQFKQCIQCQDGYYLDSENQCVQCSSSCIKCEKQKDNCTQCKYLNYETNQCLLCSEDLGYIEANNQCLPVCGDGIKTKNENCDDGNIINGDGCDQYCQIEQGYQCDVECQKINYIEILLSESQQDQLQSSKRHISFTFNQLVKFQSQQKIKDLLQVKPVYKNFEIQNLEKIDTTDYSNELKQVFIEIQFDLNQSYVKPDIQIQLFNSNLFSNQEGAPIYQNYASITILDYFQPSDFLITSTKSAITFNLYVLYILFGLAISTFIFGGLEIFWNLLDTLQLICYLKYFNVTYPYNLSFYFKLFSFGEFDFIKNQFDVPTIFKLQIDSQPPPEKFQYEGYDTLFIRNIISIIIIFGMQFLILLFLTLTNYIFQYLLKKLLQNNISKNSLYDFLIQYLIKFAIVILKKQQLFLLGFKNILLRTYFASAYDINVVIFLQFQSMAMNSQLEQFSVACSMICFILQIILIKKGFAVMNNQKEFFKKLKSKYNFQAFYEGINLKKGKLNHFFNLILLIKKIIFAGVLIFFYDSPIFQILVSSFLSLSLAIFLLIKKSLLDRNELYKQLSGEFILSITQITILIFAFSNEGQILISQSTKDGVGFFIIALLSLLLLLQLVIILSKIFIHSKTSIKFFRRYSMHFKQIKNRIKINNKPHYCIITIVGEQWCLNQIEIKLILQNFIKKYIQVRRKQHKISDSEIIISFKILEK